MVILDWVDKPTECQVSDLVNSIVTRAHAQRQVPGLTPEQCVVAAGMMEEDECEAGAADSMEMLSFARPLPVESLSLYAI